MEISSKTKKAGVLIGVMLIAIVILGIFLPALLKPSVAESTYPAEHLFVEATYLLKTEETNDSVNVTCDLYMTNIWDKESGKIKAIAYVIETKNNFAIFETEVEIGLINADSTSKIGIPVVLSNSSYKVDVLIFENEKLVLKGALTISARPMYSWEYLRTNGINQQWDLDSSIAHFEKVR